MGIFCLEWGNGKTHATAKNPNEWIKADRGILCVSVQLTINWDDKKGGLCGKQRYRLQLKACCFKLRRDWQRRCQLYNEETLSQNEWKNRF